MTRPQIQHKQNYSTNAVPSHMEIMTPKTEKPSQNSSGCQARVQQLRLSGKLSLSWCFNLPCSEERKRERERVRSRLGDKQDSDCLMEESDPISVFFSLLLW